MKGSFTLELNDVLSSLKLNLGTNDLNNALKNLDDLFEKGYILNYSDSYYQIKSLMEDQQTREFVFNNFESLIRLSEKGNLKHSALIKKFLDYCALETARYLDMQSHVEQLEQTTQFIQSDTSYVSEEISSLKRDVDLAKKEIDNSTPKFLTILSIFAGVVISFMGGLSLLGSAFDGVQSNYSKYRLIFMLTLAGFVIYNVVISLMFIVCRINDKNIGTSCTKGAGCNNWDCNHFVSKSIIRNLVCNCRCIITLHNVY